MTDLRYALRQLRRAPTFAATAVLILGIGIGMATAMFTIFHAVVLRKLPVRDPDRILVLWRSEEHTSELQSRQYLVCRLLLEKKKARYWQPRHTRRSRQPRCAAITLARVPTYSTIHH